MQKVEFQPNAGGPLAGVKILDLSRVFAGNSLSFYLADFGADVLKIEQPGHGDPLRAIKDGGVPVYWKVMCRNKRSLAIDLKSPEGVEAVLALAADADILIENFRPGDLEKFGLEPEKLHRANPKLVIIRISGWGATGPYRHKLGFGTLIEAFSGFAAKNGFPGSPPLLPNMGLADLVCGLTGGIAALVALRVAESEGGRGQVIDLSILDAMITFLGNDPGAFKVTGRVPERVGNRGQVAAPRNLYRTSDGHYMALSASTQTMARKVLAAINRPDLNDDPRFLDNDARMENADTLDELIEAFTLERTLADNLAFFDRNQITVGPVNDIELLLRDPHIIARGVVVEIEDEDAGMLPMPAPPARLSATPATLRRAAPKLGEHTKEALQDIGWSEERINRLIESKVIQTDAQ